MLNLIQTFISDDKSHFSITIQKVIFNCQDEAFYNCVLVQNECISNSSLNLT